MPSYILFRIQFNLRDEYRYKYSMHTGRGKIYNNEIVKLIRLLSTVAQSYAPFINFNNFAWTVDSSAHRWY